MTDVRKILDHYENQVKLNGLNVVSTTPVDQFNTASLDYRDSSGRQYAFTTDGQMFRLRAIDYEFLEFEYDEAYDVALADNLLAVAQAVGQQQFRRIDAKRIEVCIGGRFFEGRRLRGK